LASLHEQLPGEVATELYSRGSEKDWAAEFLSRDGFVRARQALWWEDLQPLQQLFEAPLSKAGARGILAIPEVAALARSARVRALVEPVLGPNARPVRGIFFDKNEQANWTVPWHQDVTIAVRERHEVPGYGPWSVKEGVPHVQPPVEVLVNMLAVRLHLDDCPEENGALRVIPRSHRHGKLSGGQIDEMSAQPRVVCEAKEGDALLMRPLLLHASSPAKSPSRRRVIHLEFAAAELPAPLEWAESTRT